MKMQDARAQAVVALVCAACGVTVEGVRSLNNHDRWLVDVRLLAAWAARKATGSSPRAIGRALNRSRGAVGGAFRRVERECRRDTAWRHLSDTLIECCRRLSGEQATAMAVRIVAGEVARLRRRRAKQAARFRQRMLEAYPELAGTAVREAA